MNNGSFIVYPSDFDLLHHGIKGQRWGVRRFQNKDGSLTALGKSRQKDDRGEKSSEDTQESKKGLSDKQKKAIKIGAAVVATAAITYGTYRLVKSGKMDKYITTGKDYVKNLLEKNQTTIEGVKKLKKPESLSDTLKNANPNVMDQAYKNNCTLCSIASFLRQKGLDVTAGTTGGKPQQLGEKVEECFKGAKILEGSAVKFGRSKKDAAEMLVSRFGNNASGVCSIQWKKGGGHAFNWTIKDGVVSFFDGQRNRDDSQVSRYWDLINPNGGLTIARLDNAEVNYEGVKRLLR